MIEIAFMLWPGASEVWLTVGFQQPGQRLVCLVRRDQVIRRLDIEPGVTVLSLMEAPI